MKTNLSVKLNALLIVLLVAIMACSVFSVVFAEKAPAKKDYVNVFSAPDGEYAIEYDTKGMAKGAKYFYNIAIVEKKGRKYNLTLLQKGSDVKMTEMQIDKPKVIKAKTTPDGDKVRYVFENVPKNQLETTLQCSTFVPKMAHIMGGRPPFELKIDMTKGMKFNDIDVLLGDAPNPDDAKVVMPMGMIIGIVVMVVVVVAVIAVIVIVVVKKNKKKNAVKAVIAEAKNDKPVEDEGPADEIALIDEDAPAGEPVVEDKPVEDTPVDEPVVEDAPAEEEKKDEPKED